MTPIADGRVPHSFVSDSSLRDLFVETFEEKISGTELDLLKSILSGMTLREISDRDGVAYETRRNQLKSLQSKSRTHKQADLLVRFSSLVSLRAKDLKFAGSVTPDTLRSHLTASWAGPFRVYPWSGDAGNQLLVCELGPLEGRPILMLHSGFHPVFPLPSDAQHLVERGLRLIIPYRPGFFGSPVPEHSSKTALDAHLANLTEFVLVYRLQDVPVLAFNQGVETAIWLVKSGVLRAQNLLGVSPNFVRGGKIPDVSLAVRAAIKVAQSAPRSAAMFFRAALITARSGKDVSKGLQRYFGQSRADRDDIAKSTDSNDDMYFLQRAMLDCLPGFVNDLAGVTREWPSLPPEDTEALRFVFAEQEAFTFLDLLSSDPVYGASEVHVIPDCGRMGMLMKPEAILDILLPAPATLVSTHR